MHSNNDLMDPNWRPPMRDGQLFTREEIMHAFAQAYCTPENSKKVLDSEIGIAMCEILFPQEQK